MNSSVLNKGIKLIELLRDIDPQMHIQTALVFLAVAEAGELRVKDIYNKQGRFGLGQSSAARNIRLLVEWKDESGKWNGHGLLVTCDDPEERRRKLIRLSPTGKALAERLGKALS